MSDQTDEEKRAAFKVPLTVMVDDQAIQKLDRLLGRFKALGPQYEGLLREDVARQAIWKGMDDVRRLLTQLEVDGIKRRRQKDLNLLQWARGRGGSPDAAD